jgi:hemin uptake protein HemP
MSGVPKPMPGEQPGRPDLRAGAQLNPSGAVAPGAVQSAELFRGQKSVLIEHNGASYRLQTTKLGKLILTK